MVAIVLACLALSSTFEDVHHRFTVDLPRGWTFTPMPGDTGGATFKRVRQDVPALASIRAFPVGKTTTLETLARERKNGAAAAPGFRLIEEQLDGLAGAKAKRMRYSAHIDEEGKLVKIVEERMALIAGVAYVVHVETLASEFGSFETDFAKLFESFSPGTKSGKSGNAKVRSPVVGRWAMAADPSSILELKSDGSLVMGTVLGRFVVQGKSIVAMLEGGREEFTWSIVAGDLVLNSAALDHPIRYTRVR